MVSVRVLYVRYYIGFSNIIPNYKMKLFPFCRVLSSIDSIVENDLFSFMNVVHLAIRFLEDS